MKIAKLGDICNIVSGGTPSRSKTEFWKEGTIPWVKIGNIKSKYVTEVDEFITQAGLDGSSAKMLSKGTILYTIFATLGEVGILTFDACTNQAIAGITIKNESKILTDYLYYYLKSKKNYVNDIGRGVAQNNINMSLLKDFVVPLPDLEAQEHIIAIIENVEEIIALRQHQLLAFDTLIKARFVEMFGDFETNPKGWTKGYLNEHASVMVGYPFPSEGYSSEGVDIVGGYNLMQGYIQWEESKHWPSVEGFESYMLCANDIVMAMDRPWVNGGFKIARIDATHLPAILIQRTACIRGKDVEQVFLYYMLDSERFAKHCNITGSLVPHISNKDINSYQIILPPRDVQKQFVAFVAHIDKSKVVVQKALEKAQLLLDCLMQKYFG